MQVNKILKLISVINDTGRVASDMYALDKKYYHSQSKDEYIPIAEMDIQYLIRAFIKLINGSNDARYDNLRELCQENDKQEKEMQDIRKKYNEVHSINYNLKIKQKELDEQLLYQEKIIDGLRNQVKTLNDVIEEKKLEVKPKDYTLEELRKEKDEALDEGVSLSNQLESLKEQLEEKEELINKLSKEEQRWRKAYARDCYTQGWRYVFSEIPNDTEGQEFVDTCKKYLNRESYTLRVKGQHIKDELKGQGRTAYGQNLSESSCIRIYIDTKKGE